MKKFRMVLAGLGLLAVSVPVHAQGGYWGIGLSRMEAEDEIGDSIEPMNLYGHLGHDTNRHFGFEVQTSFSLVGDSQEAVDWYASVVGIYLKGGMPLSDSANVYVLGGVSRVELTADLGFVSARDDESGPSYGLGADVALSDDMEMFVRYMNYLDEDGLFNEVTGLNVGIGWSF